MQYDQIEKTLTPHIQAGRTQQAIEFVNLATDYNEGENMVAVALNTENCPQEVVDAALERFIATRVNRHTQHGYWVHSLSHFTGKLWERNLTTWVKRLNEIAFIGANDLGDSNCCDRLVGDFVKHASWDSIPAEYGYTKDNLKWAGESYGATLIKSLPFKSEVDFIKFELKYPKRFTRFDFDAQDQLVDGEKLHTFLHRLKQLGVDVTETSGMFKSMLRTSLEKFEGALKQETNTTMIERANKAIEKTKAMLAKVTAV